MTIATKPTKSVTRTEPNDPSLVTIYSTISARHIRRVRTGAVKVSRSRAQLLLSGFPEFWEAAAFTPSANHTVTKIEVAVGYRGRDQRTCPWPL